MACSDDTFSCFTLDIFFFFFFLIENKLADRFDRERSKIRFLSQVKKYFLEGEIYNEM